MKTVDGEKDAISLLYSREDVDQYITYPIANQNGYNVTLGKPTNTSDAVESWDLKGPTWTVKMLITGALESHLSVDSGDLLLAEVSSRTPGS